MYLDEQEKLKYLLDRIASTLVASEIFPDRTIIDKRLADIDTKIALFNHTNIKEKERLNVEQLNNEFMAVYQDLLILYKLVYYFAVTKFNNTKAYIDTHLSELEAYARRYRHKAEFETSNVTTGKTVFFQGNGFSPNTANFKTTLNLGKIKVSKGSKLSFHIKGHDFDIKDVIFKLGDMRCLSYDINHDYLEIPGRGAEKTIYCEIPADINRNTMFPLSAQNFSPIINNTYMIYGGKNCISNISGNKETIYTKDTNNAITMKESRGRISFYILGGTYIDFDFNEAPVSQNFVGYSLQGLKDKHFITFEYDSNNFSFNYITDGIVYAVCRHGIVKDDSLYYPSADNDIHDFMIQEYSSKDLQEYDLSIEIKHHTRYEPYIEMVAVKEYSDI